MLIAAIFVVIQQGADIPVLVSGSVGHTGSEGSIEVGIALIQLLWQVPPSIGAERGDLGRPGLQRFIERGRVLYPVLLVLLYPVVWVSGMSFRRVASDDFCSLFSDDHE